MNINYRDIKPENLVLENFDSDNQFKLKDFGLAERFSLDYGQTSEDVIFFERCGSPGYTAPEILKGKPYNTKVDIFSLGILLFVMLSGNPAFTENNITQTRFCQDLTS